jgi:hypothetical protein
MTRPNTSETEADVWGPYVNYDDVARLHYGGMLWRNPAMRARLLAHWLDHRHPGHERFSRARALVEETLASSESDARLDCRLRAGGTSLRCVAREIPPVFGRFFR